MEAPRFTAAKEGIMTSVFWAVEGILAVPVYYLQKGHPMHIKLKYCRKLIQGRTRTMFTSEVPYCRSGH
jgi:hypothetical protein